MERDRRRSILSLADGRYRPHGRPSSPLIVGHHLTESGTHSLASLRDILMPPPNMMCIQHAPGVVEFRVLPRRRRPASHFAFCAAAAVSAALFVRTGDLTIFSRLRLPGLVFLVVLGWLLTRTVLHGSKVLSHLSQRLKPRLIESLLVFEHLGVQLETSRGCLGWHLSTTSQFIPATAIQDIVINEALSAWQFKHYLAILHIRPTDSQAPPLSVAFPNILPPVTLLSEIYRHVHTHSHEIRPFESN